MTALRRHHRDRVIRRRLGIVRSWGTDPAEWPGRRAWLGAWLGQDAAEALERAALEQGTTPSEQMARVVEEWAAQQGNEERNGHGDA